MHWSLKNKLVFSITLTSGLLLFIGVAFISFQNINIMKAHLVEQAKSTINLTGNYCISSLSFEDKESAEYVLESLADNDNILHAVLYDEQGSVFAQYKKQTDFSAPKFDSGQDTLIFDNTNLRIFHSLYYLNKKYGTLFIAFSTESLSRQVSEFIYSVIVILGLLFLLAIFMAHIFQKIIIRPVLALSDTTKKITENQDYSVRVKSRPQDEIGILYDAFNNLLDDVHRSQQQVNKAFAALRESEERYRKVVELSPNGIILHKEGKILYGNAAAVKLAGYTNPEELIGKNIFDFVHADFTEKVKERIAGMKSGVRDLPQIEEKLRRADGSILIAQVAAIPFFFDEQLTILTILQDITKIREAEQALRRSEVQFRSIFERSNDAMYVLTGERFSLVNPRFIELFGYTEEEVLSQDFNLMDLVSEQSKEHILKRREQNRRRQFEPSAYAFRAVTKDGRPLEVEVNLSQIEWDGKPAILGIIRDVTEQRMLAEQLQQSQKMEAIGVLAGGVAHDFNNLLTVISGHVELSLMKTDKDSMVFRHLTEIDKAGKRAQDLTRQLLAFSRKQVVQLQSVNINDLIKDMYKMLVRLIGEDIRLDTVLTKKIAPVKADPGQLDQILMNLIVNAADAINIRSGQGFKRRITIETDNVYLDDEGIEFPGTENGSGLYVLLSVSDTGVGMDEEVRSKIFDPFFTTKGMGKGTGLGMSTIYGIVKQNNGRIHVYSEKDLGTTVKIYWPSDQSKTSIKGKQKNQHDIIGGQETILFVEDEDSVREFAVTALRDLGYKIYQAGNAGQALHLVHQEKIKYDILVTDMVMPEMSGNELAEKLQESNPALKVIFTSGYTDGKLVNKGVLDESIHFLQKPYSVKTLSSIIRQVLDK